MNARLFAALLLLASSPALAQPTPATPAAAPASVPASAEPVDPDSPRACMAQFLDLARHGLWDQAATYLDVPADRRAEAPELARRLKAVLDRYVWLDVETLSPRPEGRTDDELPALTDDVGRVSVLGKHPAPIRIVRQRFADGPRWVFARATVQQVDAWYDQLEDRWIRDHLPAPLLEAGPRGLLRWQWLGLPVLALLALLLGIFFGWLVRKLLAPIFRRTKTTWDDELLARMHGPLSLLFALLAARALLPSLGLNPSADTFIVHALKAGNLVAVFWALLRGIDLGIQIIAVSPWAKAHPASLGMLPLGSRVAKIVALGMAVIAVLSELGYPVASLLAGLGIGGLALALAAQKTVENLFGSVSISVDQPFRVGDFIKVEDVMGTVEFVGLRSTRIRTLGRTLVTIPNGKLADMRTETFAPRDRIQLATTVGLVYGAKAEQVKAVIEALRAYLKGHEKVWQDDVIVALSGLGDSSINIEVMVWFASTDFGAFRKFREEFFFKVLEIVQAAGTEMAYPTRTVVLQKTA